RSRMLIVTRPGVTAEEVDAIRERAEARGASTCVARQGPRAVIACLGEAVELDRSALAHPAIEAVLPLTTPYPLAARGLVPHAERAATVLPLGDDPRARLGGREVVVIAGPCSVENAAMLRETAHAVRRAGAGLLRGGAFKPRTSPYAFQGLGLAGLRLLAEARRETGLPVVTEVMDPRLVEQVAEYADVLQVGARNMQNFPL